MAKLWYRCASLCIFLGIFLRIPSVLSDDDYYSYKFTTDLHDRSEHSLALELRNEDTHTYHKRDIPIQNIMEDVRANSTSQQNTTGEILTSQKNASEEIPIPPPTKKADQPQQTILNNTTLLKDPLTKNLGVDGAGQKKNITLDHPPLLHNLTDVFAKNNQTGGDDSEIAIKYPGLFDAEKGDQNLNKALTDHNITKSQNDTHHYYNSTFNTDPEVGRTYWIDMNNRSDVKVNELLSHSHRRAATIKLSFEFPFYGHLIKNVTVATGGFLYTGDFVHSWLAATQYIAPLMANFDTSLSNDSCIKYVDNGTSFTVEWEKVALQDKPTEGEFTFQVTLHKNGDIVFVYKNVPLFVENIQDIHHPVKVGLSDAYIMDRTVFYVRRKTIYEYHRVNFPKEDIKNWTMIYLKALPTCLDSLNCYTCLTRKIAFQCSWCPSLKKCSNGIDRHRQDWMRQECDKTLISNETQCEHVTDSDIYLTGNSPYSHEFEHLDDNSRQPQIYQDDGIQSHRLKDEKVGVSGILAILFLVAMVSGLAVWIFYAYRNPHTTSGQMLIRYRPSQWRWRRGEARYTAATIHM